MSKNAKSIVKIKRLENCFDEDKEIYLPERATTGSAGVDLQAAINEPVYLSPGAIGLIPTGLAFELPKGMELQVRPRSGLALKHALTVLNSPGTVDADYRGECCVILINHSKEVFLINRGDRIAQAVFNNVALPELIEVKELDETDRGDGGFGSTGTKTI